MSDRTNESQTGGTDLTTTVNWDAAFAEASRRVFPAPFWWYMSADITATPESSLPTTPTYEQACKHCSKADWAVTDREVSRS